MRRTVPTVIAAVSALAIATATATAQRQEVVPGITYERVASAGQVIHVTRVNPGPNITARPTALGSPRGRLTRAVQQRTGSGAVVGVNGDFFNWDTGIPSGLFLEEGRLVNEPEASRSALVFSRDGWMAAIQTQVEGTWVADPTDQDPVSREHRFVNANRPADRNTESRTILYTSDFGRLTPRGARTEALIRLDAPGVVIPNRPISGTVHSVSTGGASGIPPGFALITGTGSRAANVARLTPGRRVTLNAVLPGIPDTAYSAMGGGPVLVANGQAVMNGDANGFSSSQVHGRSARTAIGQTRTGQILLVVTEGPLEGRVGMTANQQAELMKSLGARTAIAMDSGGSSGMVIRGRMKNAVRSGERSISNGLIVSYAGVQLTDPSPLVSPNRDRVNDTTTVIARSAKSGTANIVLRRPGRKAVRLLHRGPLGPGGTALRVGTGARLTPGVYEIAARHTPADGSSPTEHRRRLVIDDTLGSLSARRTGTGANQRLGVRFRLQRNARVTVQAVNARGKVVRVLARNRAMKRGVQNLSWNMRQGARPIPAGAYTVRVVLRTKYRQPNVLTKRFTALRAPAPKKR